MSILSVELQDKLHKDFPSLYSNLNDNFWIPEGWYDFVYNLSSDVYEEIQKLDESIKNDYYVVQVKIKFSGLRYYMSKSTPTIDEIISIYENKSYDICVYCGKDLCTACAIIKNIIE